MGTFLSHVRFVNEDESSPHDTSGGEGGADGEKFQRVINLEMYTIFFQSVSALAKKAVGVHWRIQRFLKYQSWFSNRGGVLESDLGTAIEGGATG